MIKSKLKYMLKLVVSNKYLFAITLLLLFADNAFADADAHFREHCRIELFDEKYSDNSPCWSCNIIFSLLTAFLNVSQLLYDSILNICKLVIQLGGAIWIATFFLKSLGSMAAQDPMKIMDGLFMFMVKWAFVYALIVAGLDEIIGLIVSPILSVGFDIGQTFVSSVS